MARRLKPSEIYGLQLQEQESLLMYIDGNPTVLLVDDDTDGKQQIYTA